MSGQQASWDAWATYDSAALSKPKVVPESSVTGALFAASAVALFALARWRASRVGKKSALHHMGS